MQIVLPETRTGTACNERPASTATKKSSLSVKPRLHTPAATKSLVAEFPPTYRIPLRSQDWWRRFNSSKPQDSPHAQYWVNVVPNIGLAIVTSDKSPRSRAAMTADSDRSTGRGEITSRSRPPNTTQDRRFGKGEPGNRSDRSEESGISTPSDPRSAVPSNSLFQNTSHCGRSRSVRNRFTSPSDLFASVSYLARTSTPWSPANLSRTGQASWESCAQYTTRRSVPTEHELAAATRPEDASNHSRRPRIRRMQHPTIRNGSACPPEEQAVRTSTPSNRLSSTTDDRIFRQSRRPS